MMEDYDYGFLDYDYYGVYKHDPLYVIMINEQFELLRKSFYKLDNNTKYILDYFIIQRQCPNHIDIDLDKYIKKLKQSYLDMYGL